MKRFIIFSIAGILVTNALSIDPLLLQTVSNSTVNVSTPLNISSNSNSTVNTKPKLSNQSTETFVLSGIFLIIYSVLFYFYYKRGQVPTSRCKLDLKEAGKLQNFNCAFDILGKLNPGEESKFENNSDPNKALVAKLKEEYAKTNKNFNQVPDEITARVF